MQKLFFSPEKPFTVIFLHLLSVVILATIPILFAAAQPFVWPVYTVLMYLAFALLLWVVPPGERPRSGKVAYLFLGPFFLTTLFLCLPLPDSLLAFFSPTRFALLQEAQVLSGRPAIWRSLGYTPLQGLAWWGFLLSCALFYQVLVAHFKRRRLLGRTLGLLFGLAVAQSLYGLLQALVPSMGVLWVDYIPSGLGKARGTWINRNHFAGYLEMMIPLFLGYLLAQVDWHGRISIKTLLQSDRLHRHGLFLLGLLLMALALVFSQSRTGITGGFVGLAAFLAMLGAGGRRVPKAAWLMVGALACLVLFYGSRIGFDPVLERFLALGEDTSRLDLWRDSKAMILAHPLGIGPAAFKSVFPLYYTHSSPGGPLPHYLHSDVLQVLTDTGWIGFASLAGGLVFFFTRELRGVRRMDPYADPVRFFTAVGAMGGMTALIFHSFFDFNLQIPANLVYFVMLMAIVRSCTAGAAIKRISHGSSIVAGDHRPRQ
jgi:hypothetical protein